MGPVARSLARLGILGLALMIPIAVTVMVAANACYLVEQYRDLVRTGWWTRPWLWPYPIWRTAAVTVAGIVVFDAEGREIQDS